MIKKTISYEDFNGKEHVEDFYFNLSKSELTRMEMRETTILNDEAVGGLNARIQAIVDSGSGRLIIEVFEDLIKQAYGVRSEDGKKFLKNEEVLEDFTSSNAYDALFMELVTDAKSAAQFINGIVPKDIAEGSVGAPQDHKSKAKSTTPSKLSVVGDTDDIQTVEDSNVSVVAEDSEELTGLSKEELEVLQKMRSGKTE